MVAAREEDMSTTEAAAGSPHLLVVDDDVRLRALLQRYLSGNGFRVTAAANAAEARSLIKSLEFDALVLDVMMPGENGFDLAEAVRAESEVPILMLTAKGEAADRIEGLERGADDYLGKPFEPRELALRLNALLRRSRSTERAALSQVRMGAHVFDLVRGDLRKDGKPVRLTGSEVQLLKVLAANAGRSFSRSALCEKLAIALERSVDVQVTRLRRKIEDDPKVPLYIQTVRGVGYVLVPDSVE
jgi:two-component system phosphate regulon response regulator OmpR